MNKQTDRFIGVGGGTSPNDCSVVTADGKVISMAGGETVGPSVHGKGTPDKREKARTRIVEEHKKEEDKNNLPIKLSGWEDIIGHMRPNIVPEAHFIIMPDQEDGTAWFFPSCVTYFISSDDWKELCEYGMNWWAERSEELAYISDSLPDPYSDPALEPLLSMVRPKVVKNNT